MVLLIGCNQLIPTCSSKKVIFVIFSLISSILPVLRLDFRSKHKDAKIFEIHLDHIMLPGIHWIALAEHSASTLR